MKPNHWRPPAADTRLRWLLLYRVLPVATLLVVIGLFFYLLFEPFFHPHAQLFFAAADYSDGGLAGSLPAQDLEAVLVPQVAAISTGQSGGASAPAPIESPDSFEARLNQIERVGMQTDDVFIAWISAQVLVRSDQPQLLCENCDPANMQNGCYSLARLFDHLKRLDAGAKLAVLDPARTTYLPRLGIMPGDTTARIAEAVHATRDRHLWVIVASGDDQQGNAGGMPPRSVLAEYLGEALRGAADRNNDRYVDLAEVDRFLRERLKQWVQKELQGQRNQTMLLAWGGGEPPSAATMPQLLPIATIKLPESEALKAKTSAATALLPPPPTGDRKADEMHLAQLPARLSLTRSLAVATDRSAGARPADISKLVKSGSGAVALPASPPSLSISNEKLLAATPAELLSMAWSLHDRLAASDSLRPVERAPHLWRAVQDQLIANDMAAATGRTDRVTALATDLRRVVRQLDDLAGGHVPQRFQRRDLVADLAQWTARPIDNLPPLSLAMVEKSSQFTGAPADANAAAFSAELDAQLAKPVRGDFSKWMDKQPAALDVYAECRLARRFAGGDDTDWDKVVLAMQTLREGERAAAATLETGIWTRRHIERGDALRREGQRLLLAAVHPSDPSIAVGLLNRAQDDYQQALAGSDDATTLSREIDAALYDLPDELAWFITSVSGPESSAPDPAAFTQALADLTEAIEVLDHPSPDRLPDVRRVLRQLDVSVTRLRQPLVSRAAPSPSVDGPVKGKVHAAAKPPVADPLLAADIRLRLRGLTEPAGAAAWAQSSSPFLLAPVDRARRFRAAVQLYDRAVRMVLRGALDDSELGTSALAPNAPAKAWVAASQELEEASLTGGKFWSEAAGYTETVRDLLAELPELDRQSTAANQDLSDPSRREVRIVGLLQARRWLTLVDPRDAAIVELPSPGELVDQARLYDLLVWQRSRLRDELQGGFENNAAQTAAQIAACDLAARAIERQPPLTEPAVPPLELNGPQQVDLADRSDEEFSFTVANHRDRAVEVWLSVDFDPALVEVGSRDGDAVYDENPARYRGLFSSLSKGIRPEPLPTALPASSLHLQPGEARTVWMRARRVSLAGGDARVAIRASTRDDSVRRDLLVALPRRLSVDLLTQGEPDTFQATANGWALYPFPNSTTTYQFFLVNQSSAERKVGVDIYRATAPQAAFTPRGDVAAAVADEFLRRVGATAVAVKVEQVVLPTGSDRVPIPFTPYVAPPDKPPKPNAKPPAEPPPEATPLAQTLIAVITDRVTGRRAVKQIEILTQRPARYLVPTAHFDPLRRRAEIHFTAAKPRVLPIEGVHVVARPEVEPAEGLFHSEATLRAGDKEAVLHVEVPRDSGEVFAIVLDVDGFSRAFRYEVPAHAATETPLPEATHPAVRIIAPKAGEIYGPDTTEVDTALQVDTARGLLLDDENTVEIGLDTQRDRELDHKDTTRLTSDRQVDLRIAELTADGKLAIRTKVADLNVKLPPPALKAARVNVLARLTLANGSVWSNPVEVIFDNQGPRMSQLHLVPGAAVERGESLNVSVLASDNDLSGVAKVEAAFDADRRGEFGEKPPIAGVQQADGRWLVELPTKPLPAGAYSVLVRATDRAGNASEYLKAKVDVFMKPPGSDKPKLGRIAGTVAYGRFEKRPEAGVVVHLAGAKPDQPVREATSNDQGEFVFEDVAPGDYKLDAEALLGGNRRVAKEVVKVSAPPAETPPVVMILESVRPGK